MGELFHDPSVFGPLDLELALYAVEATLLRQLRPESFEGCVTDMFDCTVREFFDASLDVEVSEDPLFVAQVLRQLARSAQLEAAEQAQAGVN
jgi:hypothetical protein